MKIRENTPFLFRNRILASFILALLVILVYANALSSEFVWDDQTIVVRNEAIRSFDNIPYVFSNEFCEKVSYNGNIYRPTQEFSYMADYFLWALEPFGFHLTSVLFHAAAVIALFYLVWGISRSGMVSFAASALFAVHPLNTEAVAYISGRSDSICFLFVALSFLFYLKSENKKYLSPALIFSWIFYILALLSRETAVIFPLLLIAYDAFAKKERRIEWNRIIPFFAILALYAFLRLKLIELNPARIQRFGAGTIILTDIKILSEYLKIIFFPFGLHMTRYMAFSDTIDPAVITAGIFLLPVMALFIWLYRKREIFFWVLWLVIFILPHLNLVRLNALYAEHWIYASAIGIYAIFGYFLKFLWGKRGTPRIASYAILAGAILYFGSLTVIRNFDWKDEPSIYLNTLKYSKSPKVMSNLGVYYDIRGEYDRAIAVYETALAAAPNTPLYHNNIAIVYMKKGNTDKALFHWKKSLSINPAQPEVKKYIARYGG